MEVMLETITKADDLLNEIDDLAHAIGMTSGAVDCYEQRRPFNAVSLIIEEKIRTLDDLLSELRGMARVTAATGEAA
jgi:hypothetical protein